MNPPIPDRTGGLGRNFAFKECISVRPDDHPAAIPPARIRRKGRAGLHAGRLRLAETGVAPLDIAPHQNRPSHRGTIR